MTNGLEVVVATLIKCKGVNHEGDYVYKGDIEVPVIVQSLRNGDTNVICPCFMRNLLKCDCINDVGYKKIDRAKCFYLIREQ